MAHGWTLPSSPPQASALRVRNGPFPSSLSSTILFDSSSAESTPPLDDKDDAKKTKAQEFPVREESSQFMDQVKQQQKQQYQQQDNDDSTGNEPQATQRFPMKEQSGQFMQQVKQQQRTQFQEQPKPFNQPTQKFPLRDESFQFMQQVQQQQRLQYQEQPGHTERSPPVLPSYMEERKQQQKAQFQEFQKQYTPQPPPQSLNPNHSVVKDSGSSAPQPSSPSSSTATPTKSSFTPKRLSQQWATPQLGVLKPRKSTAIKSSDLSSSKLPYEPFSSTQQGLKPISASPPPLSSSDTTASSVIADSSSNDDPTNPPLPLKSSLFSSSKLPYDPITSSQQELKPMAAVSTTPKTTAGTTTTPNSVSSSNLPSQTSLSSSRLPYEPFTSSQQGLKPITTSSPSLSTSKLPYEPFSSSPRALKPVAAAVSRFSSSKLPYAPFTSSPEQQQAGTKPSITESQPKVAPVTTTTPNTMKTSESVATTSRPPASKEPTKVTSDDTSKLKGTSPTRNTTTTAPIPPKTIVATASTAGSSIRLPYEPFTSSQGGLKPATPGGGSPIRPPDDPFVSTGKPVAAEKPASKTTAPDQPWKPWENTARADWTAPRAASAGSSVNPPKPSTARDPSSSNPKQGLAATGPTSWNTAPWQQSWKSDTRPTSPNPPQTLTSGIRKWDPQSPPAPKYQTPPNPRDPPFGVSTATTATAKAESMPPKTIEQTVRTTITEASPFSSGVSDDTQKLPQETEASRKDAATEKSTPPTKETLDYGTAFGLTFKNALSSLGSTAASVSEDVRSPSIVVTDSPNVTTQVSSATVEDLKETLKEKENAYTEASTKLQNLQEELKVAQGAQEQQRLNYEQTRADFESKITAKTIEVQELISKAAALEATLKKEVESHGTALSGLEMQLQQAQNELNEQHTEQQKYVSAMEALAVSRNAKIADLATNVEALESACKEKDSEVAEKRAKLEATQQGLDAAQLALQRQLVDYEQSKAGLESIVATKSKELIDLTARVADLEDELKSTVELQAREGKRRVELEKQQEKAQTELKEQQKEQQQSLSAMMILEESQKAQVADLSSKVDRLQSDLKMKEAALANVTANAGFLQVELGLAREVQEQQRFKYEQSKKDLESKVALKDEDIKHLSDRVATLEDERKQEVVGHNAKVLELEKKLQAAQEKLQELRQDKERNQAELKEKEQELAMKVSAAKAAVSKALQQREADKQQNMLVSAKLETLQRNLEAAEGAYSRQLLELEQAKSTLEAVYAAKSKELEDALSKVTLLEAEVGVTNNNLDFVQEELSAAQETYQQQLQALNQTRSGLETTLAAKTIALEDLTARLAELEERHVKDSDNLVELVQQLSEAQQELDGLQKQQHLELKRKQQDFFFAEKETSAADVKTAAAKAAMVDVLHEREAEKQKKEEAEAKLEFLTRQFKGVQEELLEIQDAKRKLEGNVSAKVKDIAELAANAAKESNKRTELEAQLTAAEIELQTLKKMYNETVIDRSKLAEVEQQLVIAQQELLSLEKSKSMELEKREQDWLAAEKKSEEGKIEVAAAKQAVLEVLEERQAEKDQREKVEANLAALQRKLETTENDHQEELKLLEMAKADLEAVVLAKSNEIDDLTARVATLEFDLMKEKSSDFKSSSKLGALEQQLKAAQSERQELEKLQQMELERKRIEWESAENKSKLGEIKVAAAKEAVLEALQERDKEKDQREKVEAKLNALQKKLDGALQAQKKELLELAQSKATALEAEVLAQNADVSDLKAKIDVLLAEKQSERNKRMEAEAAMQKAEATAASARESVKEVQQQLSVLEKAEIAQQEAEATAAAAISAVEAIQEQLQGIEKKQKVDAATRSKNSEAKIAAANAAVLEALEQRETERTKVEALKKQLENQKQQALEAENTKAELESKYIAKDSEVKELAERLKQEVENHARELADLVTQFGSAQTELKVKKKSWFQKSSKTRMEDLSSKVDSLEVQLQEKEKAYASAIAKLESVQKELEKAQEAEKLKTEAAKVAIVDALQQRDAEMAKRKAMESVTSTVQNQLKAEQMARNEADVKAAAAEKAVIDTLQQRDADKAQREEAAAHEAAANAVEKAQQQKHTAPGPAKTGVPFFAAPQSAETSPLSLRTQEQERALRYKELEATKVVVNILNNLIDTTVYSSQTLKLLNRLERSLPAWFEMDVSKALEHQEMTGGKKDNNTSTKVDLEELRTEVETGFASLKLKLAKLVKFYEDGFAKDGAPTSSDDLVELVLDVHLGFSDIKSPLSRLLGLGS